MREPRWLPRLVVDAAQFDQIREHGGLAGIREENALESALQRAKQKWNYQEGADLAVLAAAYGFGIASNHPYRDGNKRIAFVAMAIFLGLNGYRVEVAQAEAVTMMLDLAAGRVEELQLATWLRDHLVQFQP